MIRLLLARHGVTEWNQAGRYQGQQDIPLGDLGRLQARQLGQRLRLESIDQAYCSDLARAWETASLALDGRDVPLERSDQLREMSFGKWEGLRHDQIAEQFPTDWANWIKESALAHPTGGESLNELRARLTTFFHSAANLPAGEAELTNPFAYRAAGQDVEQSRTLLFVTHGGPVRVLLTALLDIPTERYWRFGVRPASLTILDVYPEGAIAEVIGETSHLTPD